MQQTLLQWFAAHQRQLPWRQNRTPYSVWVSEIMLQQTRVDTVIPYYTRWLALFPDVQALAAADEQTVLKAWEGLGYYSRARSLHKTAKIIAEQYDGSFPADVNQLEKLPGIGRYTAGAIASIAFNQAVPALDGNIRRVYARLYDMDQPLRSKESEAELWKLAAQLVDRKSPGAYHEALMDLGATICLPANPQCLLCPIQVHCLAYAHGTVSERPVVPTAAKIPHYTVTAAVILSQNGTVLLAQRPAHGLLASLWEFPGGKLESEESLEGCLEREIMEELGVRLTIHEPFGVYKHAYTHFKVTLHAFLSGIGDQEPRAIEAQALEWVKIERLNDYPMGKIDCQIAAKLIKRFDLNKVGEQEQ